MKSVGIITYHHYYNYGTILQAFALQKKIETLGYNAEVIDYHEEVTRTTAEKIKDRIVNLPKIITSPRTYLDKIKQSKTYSLYSSEVAARIYEFEAFYKKNLHVSEMKYGSSAELIQNPPAYDGYIVGSDQTWNPNIGVFSDAFFLSFAPTTALRGSYAPSLCVEGLTLAQEEQIKSLIRNVDFLSCRETRGTDWLRRLSGKEVTTVLDPTLLVNCDEWLEYSEKSAVTGDYILQYFLGNIQGCRQFTKDLSKKLGIKIVCLPFSYLDMSENYAEKVYVGPAQFLDLVSRAAVVCTDSFHGTAFSINFGRTVYAFHKIRKKSLGSDNGRLDDILAKMGMMECLVTDYDAEAALKKTKGFDYDIVNQRLNSMRKDSVEYLLNMLKNL